MNYLWNLLQNGLMPKYDSEGGSGTGVEPVKFGSIEVSVEGLPEETVAAINKAREAYVNSSNEAINKAKELNTYKTELEKIQAAKSSNDTQNQNSQGKTSEEPNIAELVRAELAKHTKPFEEAILQQKVVNQTYEVNQTKSKLRETYGKTLPEEKVNELLTATDTVFNQVPVTDRTVKFYENYFKTQVADALSNDLENISVEKAKSLAMNDPEFRKSLIEDLIKEYDVDIQMPIGGSFSNEKEFNTQYETYQKQLRNRKTSPAQQIEIGKKMMSLKSEASKRGYKIG